GEVRPARVVVVDPSDPAQLAAKAPVLHALGLRAKSRFCHVQQSGSVFLEHLRMEFSRGFVRTVLHAGRDAYADLAGVPADPAWLESASTDTETLWSMRRDLEGCRPNQPSCRRVPPDEPLVGLMILQ